MGIESQALQPQVDNSTLEIGTSGLQIKDDGVTTSQILGSTILKTDLASGVVPTIQQLYTSTALNVSASGIVTDTNEFELDAVATTGADYVIIEFTSINTSANNDGGTYAFNRLQLQIKEVGGAYADYLPLTTIQQASGIQSDISDVATIKIIHLLTAGEKANGFQIKVISSAVGTHASSSAVITLIQLVETLI